ncbi:hypothetical protein ACOMHN_012007 [Nucella lapillus]
MLPLCGVGYSALSEDGTNKVELMEQTGGGVSVSAVYLYKVVGSVYQHRPCTRRWGQCISTDIAQGGGVSESAQTLHKAVGSVYQQTLHKAVGSVYQHRHCTRRWGQCINTDIAQGGGVSVSTQTLYKAVG